MAASIQPSGSMLSATSDGAYNGTAAPMDTIPDEMLATPKALRFHHFPCQCSVVTTGAVSQVRCRFLLQPGAAN
jgi:hypothetical protein